jgi:hypothetical protein
MRTGSGQAVGNVKGGGITDVVRVRFEGCTQYRKGTPCQAAAAEFSGK